MLVVDSVTMGWGILYRSWKTSSNHFVFVSLSWINCATQLIKITREISFDFYVTAQLRWGTARSNEKTQANAISYEETFLGEIAN